MNCPNCGAPNNEGVMNCYNCGAPMPQPAYGYAPVQPAAVPGKGLGIAGMILGILSIIITCFISAIVGLVLAIGAIVLGAVGMAQAKKVGMKNGMGVAGLVCGIVAIGIWVAAVTFLAAVFASLM